MLTNENLSAGNVDIVLKNLIIDGNRENDTPNVSTDDLSQIYDEDRFSGLKFSNVSDSKLINITVQYTVNGEQVQDTPAGGIFFTNGCNNIEAHILNAYNNDYNNGYNNDYNSAYDNDHNNGYNNDHNNDNNNDYNNDYNSAYNNDYNND